MAKEDLMEKITTLAKQRGFIFAGSEIYGGLANSWDYGPLGVELKNNIKQRWWKRFVQDRDDIVGLDAALIMNPKVWEASGHLTNFSDPLVECGKCQFRERTDKLIDNIKHYKLVQKKLLEGIKKSRDEFGNLINETQGMITTAQSLLQIFNQEVTQDRKERILASVNEISALVDSRLKITGYAKDKILEALKELAKSSKYIGKVTQIYLDLSKKCPNCQSTEWKEPKEFNLMFKTHLGPIESNENIVYFRPETAQAMFVDFAQVLRTTRKRIPFGIAQVGKAFRNEITPGNFIFRTREFEQMEIEYFVHPEEWELHFGIWKNEMMSWLEDLGVNKNHIHEVSIPDGERAHYSKKTIDIEYDFPFGQKELYGLAYRTDFDLANHMKMSGQDLQYTDPETKEKFTPHVIEPTWGVDRSVLVAMLEAYHEEDLSSVASAKEEAPAYAKASEGKTDLRTVLKFPKWLAPIKVAILPLSKKEELSKVARSVYDQLRAHFVCEYDETQSIGKRYRRQDEIGTPYCVTVDFESLEDKMVTVRDRDSMKQERVAIKELSEYLKDKLI